MEGLPQDKRAALFSDNELALIHNCWHFVDAMRRDEPGCFPAAKSEYSMLEAYLILAYATNQAGMYRFSRLDFGDAGLHFIFPGVLTMDKVSQDQWDDFASRTSALRHKITGMK